MHKELEDFGRLHMMSPDDRLRELCRRQRANHGAGREVAVRYDAVPAMVCDIEAVLSKLGRAVDLLRYLTESIDANVTREAADFVRENTPRVPAESVRGILK